MNYFKNIKKINVLISVLLLSILLIGCGQESQSQEQANTEPNEEINQEQNEEDNDSNNESATFTFTDSTGRDVELPENIKTIAPSGSLAQMVLNTVAQDKLVGLASQPPKFVEKYYDNDYLALPAFGSFFKDTFNLEELIKADPDVIIDIGEAKGSMKEDMDEIQDTVNIPTIFIEADLESIPEAYITLGDLLGEEEQAKALASYSQDTLDNAKEITESIPEEDRVSLFFGMYETGLSTNGAGSFHSEVLDYVGVENVAILDDTGKKGGGNEVSMEQLLLWEPEVIIFAENSVYEPVTEGDELWQDLEAVKEDRVYEIPEEPYNWISFPPSVNRILGINWLGNLIYPEHYDMDMVEEAQTFFDLFYHYDLSDDEAEELLERSILKAENK